MLKFIDRYAIVILFVVVAFLFVAADGLRIINYPPWSVHNYRQSDCLAYTKTYYQNNTGFFEPAAYNLIGADGRVVSEFPILYYVSAKLCQAFGFKYSIIRGVTMLCYLIGLLYAFLCARRWIKHPLFAMFPVIILATSPYYFFYAVNYLPNVPAISFSFAGLYHLLRYKDAESIRHIVLSSVFFIVAVLLKPTDGGLIWMAYLATVALTFFKVGKVLNLRSPVLWSAIAIALSIVLWFVFVNRYNAKYGNEINLQGVYPLWDMPVNMMKYTMRERIFGVWFTSFQHPVLYWVLCACFIVFVVKWRNIDRFLRQFTLFLIIGSIVYSVLWFKAFDVHDYYQLIFTVPAFFVSVCAISFYTGHVMQQFSISTRNTVAILSAILAVVGIYHNQFIQIDRYKDHNRLISNPAVYEVEPYLRSLGISEHDKVLCVPDGSPNITLAAFGNPGYTSDLFSPGQFGVQYCKERGVQYMIIIDEKYTTDPRYEPFTSKLIGKFKGIYIYDIRG